MGTIATVFQLCNNNNMAEQGIRNKSIAICSVSKAAFNKVEINSKLLEDCSKALKLIGSNNKVNLLWVPGHSGYKGNEMADRLAREGSSSDLIGPEPYCANCITKRRVRTRVKEWMRSEAQAWWSKTPGMAHAKKFIPKLSQIRAANLLGLGRKAIRMVTGLLTGHCKLGKHLGKMGLVEDTTCRLCLEEEESAEHILCFCEALCRPRFQIMGDEKPSADSYTRVPPWKIWSLITKSGLEGVL